MGNGNSFLGHAILNYESQYSLDLSVLFKDGYNVSNQSRCCTSRMKSHLILNLGFNCLHDIRLELSSLLFDWLSIQLDVKVMHRHLRVKALSLIHI